MNIKTVEPRPEKEINYIKLPFQGYISYRIREDFSGLLHKYCPDLTFRFIIVNNYTIASFFRPKDRLSDLLCSNIVYEFTCPDCQIGYIGSANRNFKIRICEHRGVSFRTNRLITNPGFSIVKDHSIYEDHPFREKDFKIIYKAKNLSELRIAESLCIYKNRPAPNNNETSFSLNIVS